MPQFASSTALRVFNLLFGKYVAFCYRIVGLDVSTKHKFVNAKTFLFGAFLFLALFSVIYTTLTAELGSKLIALAVLGTVLQVLMRPNLNNYLLLIV